MDDEKKNNQSESGNEGLPPLPPSPHDPSKPPAPAPRPQRVEPKKPKLSWKEKLKKLMDVDPHTGVRPVYVILSKPWVIILMTIIVTCILIAFSFNQIMLAVLHSQKEVVVPEIAGRGLNESLRIVSELDLSLKLDGEEFDEGLPAGTIIQQSPPPGLKVRTGRAITVVTSKGGQAVFIPMIAGKSLAEAQSALAVEGIQLGAVSEIYSTEVRSGAIVSQSPSSGTIVTRGAFVDIEVSKGYPPAGAPLVPDFVGQRVGMARGWSEDNRIKIQVKEDARAVGVSGTVVRQRPMAGQPILRGDRLDITVVPLLASQQGFRLSYQVPKKEDSAVVRMVARDNRGESEVYRGTHPGGDTVEIPMNVNATTRVRIYVNDILKDERVIEP